MKHHFADLLDRSGNYWSIVPNLERFAYTIENFKTTNKQQIKIITIGKEDTDWEQIFEMPNLEELTLHEPNKTQIEKITQLQQLKRLRLSHARPKSIDFISNLKNLEEVVFEYVSGFSDLSPFNNLNKLKSLHFENLRRVKSFDGLIGLRSLKYLYINGTLDWNQPIEDFDFLVGIPNLEVLSLGWIKNKSEYPVFKSVLKLKRLKKIKVVRNTFQTKEFAFLETALPNVEGANWDLFWEYNDWFEFLGKRAGRVKINNSKAKEKCSEFMKQYEKMKVEAQKEIKKYCG